MKPTEHSGFFSKYLSHPETSSVERVAFKSGQNFDKLQMFFNRNDSFQLKISILLQKDLQIIQILPIFLALPSTLNVFEKPELHLENPEMYLENPESCLKNRNGNLIWLEISLKNEIAMHQKAREI